MKALICIAVLTVSQFTMAEESVWDYDSCMENTSRQFSCDIEGQKVSVDLELESTQLSYKAASDEQIYGIFVEGILGGRLYISCDDSATLKQVQFESQASSKPVRCRD